MRGHNLVLNVDYYRDPSDRNYKEKHITVKSYYANDLLFCAFPNIDVDADDQSREIHMEFLNRVKGLVNSKLEMCLSTSGALEMDRLWADAINIVGTRGVVRAQGVKNRLRER